MVVNVKLHPSYRLAGLLVAAHAGVAAAIACIDAAAPVRLGLAFVLAVSCSVAVWRSALLKGQGAIVALELGEEGAIHVQRRDGTWQGARLLRSTFVTPALTVLNLRMDGRRGTRYVVLMPDSAAEEAYRRMRVRLLWDRSRYA